MRNKNKGFSILELMMVMVVAIGVAALVWTGYSSTRSETKVRQQMDLIRYVIASADSITMTRSDYLIPSSSGTTPLDTAAIIGLTGTQNILPPGASAGGGVLYGPVGQVSVGTSSSVGSANDLVSVSIPGVPRKECIALVIKAVPGVYDIRVNNQLVGLYPAPSNGAQGRSDADPAQVQQVCNAATNTVVIRKLKNINFAALRHDGFDLFTGNEETVITPLYNRTEAAIAAREAAQNSL